MFEILLTCKQNLPWADELLSADNLIVGFKSFYGIISSTVFALETPISVMPRISLQIAVSYYKIGLAWRVNRAAKAS